MLLAKYTCKQTIDYQQWSLRPPLVLQALQSFSGGSLLSLVLTHSLPETAEALGSVSAAAAAEECGDRAAGWAAATMLLGVLIMLWLDCAVEWLINCRRSTGSSSTNDNAVGKKENEQRPGRYREGEISPWGFCGSTRCTVSIVLVRGCRVQLIIKLQMVLWSYPGWLSPESTLKGCIINGRFSEYFPVFSLGRDIFQHHTVHLLEQWNFVW